MHQDWVNEPRRKAAARAFRRFNKSKMYFKVQWWSPALSSLQIKPHGMPGVEFWASIFLNLHGFSGSLPALWQGFPCCSLTHLHVRSWSCESQQIYTPRGWDTPLLTSKAAVSCARRSQPALPASQEAWEDPGPFGGCSVPAPFVWALPRVPLLRRDQSCGCPCGAVVPGHCRNQGGQDEGRRKGERSGCCRTSPAAHFSAGSLLPSCAPQAALPTHSCLLLSSAQGSSLHPWATLQDNTAPRPLSLTHVGQPIPKIWL